ncbi:MULTISPECIES: flagella synthesis protein FlgN [Rhodanobacter]|uniref:Flagellar protein FlgN n=1 Tax=Rhodanobacter hydrolyticus TaxID=2250595 RepID=A0ABW8J8L2_9GAMM|nr:flagellar protein FlgN [Rhodanobacter sp. 7MK24]MBD8881880.1 flagellar protein FlgN [Rhodanobacter sp. 7MK24]
MTSLQHEFDQAITATLSDMRVALTMFEQVLEDERAALVAGDTVALGQAGTRKQALMQQLEQLDVERRQLANEQARAEDAPDPAWPSIVQSLQQCHRLNQRNGSIVNQRLQMVRQALAVLTGVDGGNGLYDRTGELHTTGRSRPLAAA